MIVKKRRLSSKNPAVRAATTGATTVDTSAPSARPASASSAAASIAAPRFPKSSVEKSRNMTCLTLDTKPPTRLPRPRRAPRASARSSARCRAPGSGPPQSLGARSFPVERVAVRGGLVHLVVVVVVGDVGALLPFARSTRALVLVYPEVVQLVAPGVSDRPIYANRRVLGDGTVVGVDPRAVPLRRRAQPKRTRVVPRTPSARPEPARRNRGDGPRDGKRRAHPDARPPPSREPPDRCDHRTGRGRVPHRREQTPRGYARASMRTAPVP